MDFRELADLRLFLRDLRDRHAESLLAYYDAPSGGFYHRHDEHIVGRFSKSSTATCVLSLVAADQWRDGTWNDGTQRLITGLLKGPWESAGLDKNNVFTVGFILEAVTELLRLTPTTHLGRGPLSRLRKHRGSSKTPLPTGR
jgi:hypothetical protein